MSYILGSHIKLGSLLTCAGDGDTDTFLAKAHIYDYFPFIRILPFTYILPLYLQAVDQKVLSLRNLSISLYLQLFDHPWLPRRTSILVKTRSPKASDNKFHWTSELKPSMLFSFYPFHLSFNFFAKFLICGQFI